MPAAQTPKQAGAFSPFLSQQLPGGSEILDRNLLAIKAAIGEVVDQFNRTITFIGVGGDGSAGPYVPTTRLINTTAPITGGGALSSDLTLALAIDGTLQVSGGNLGRAAISGDIVISAGSNAAAFRSFAATSVLARAAGTSGIPTELSSTGNNQVLQQAGGVLTFAALNYSQLTGSVPAITQLTGDVTAGPGSGSVAATIAAHAVTYHKMQQETPGTILGNPTAGVADVQEIVLGGGLEFATPGPTVIQRSALTGDVTAPAGSNVTTLATVATPGTYGSTGSYLASQTIDAKGRTTAVSVTSTPLAGALVYTLASTTLAMGQNQSTLVMPLPAGPPIINTAAAGVALSTTLSANWGSSVQSPPTFFTQIGSIKCTGDITFYSSSGGGQPVLVVALWYVTGNAFLPGSWHALTAQSLTLNIGTGSARAAINFSASSTSGLVPNDASLVLVLYRSDANAGTTLNTINANIVCSWGV